VCEALANQGFPARDVFGVRLALEEALVNAVKHGHGHDPRKTVLLRWQFTADEAVFEVRDEGPGFDPAAVPDPCDPHNLERPCGRGLLLMQHYMTEVRVEGRGNHVILRKRRSAG
jgi:serine/threonine-protein kinase RsbW